MADTRHQFMSHSDAFAWQMEGDAALRSTVVTVFVLDRAPDFARVREGFARAVRTVPQFRQRVVATVPPAPPRWEDDPDLDLDFHVRRVVASGADGTEPGLDVVLEMARHAEMADFDRARPLWQATVVEGLTIDGVAGRAALLVKLHHALTDGIGGVQLALALLDLGPEPTDRGPLPAVPAPRTGGRWTPWTASASYDLATALSLAREAARSAPRALRAGVLHPVESVRDAAAVAASVTRTVRPINRTGSELMAQRRLVRRLGVHQVPLAELKAAAHACDATLNDAFLAAVTGGVRRYHERHHAPVGDLHVTMPLSLRTDGDALGGNRITLTGLTHLHRPR